ncbi:MAG: hypothetical protein MUF19_00355 [Candidatus Pacebacteria bacterium]|nr:hypothetical protein [Candidatus Paceibacterota bacterium]
MICPTSEVIQKRREKEVRDVKDQKMVATELCGALQSLKTTFPNRNYGKETLGHEFIRSWIGQYGIRGDELTQLGLSFSSGVSETLQMLVTELQQDAA